MYMIDADPSMMPEIRILRCPPPMEGIARAIAKVRSLGTEVEIITSEHIRQDDGRVEPQI